MSVSQIRVGGLAASQVGVGEDATGVRGAFVRTLSGLGAGCMAMHSGCTGESSLAEGTVLLRRSPAGPRRRPVADPLAKIGIEPQPPPAEVPVSGHLP